MNEIEIRVLIDDISEKYNISKTSLSLVLGWGEKTIYRYYNSKCPKEKAVLLDKVYNNSFLFMEYLEENKNLITKISYKKSKEALKNKLNLELSDTTTIKHILSCLIFENPGLSRNSINII